VRRSRFEVDLNRPPEAAIYRTPEEAWGLEVWHGPLDAGVVAESMAEYWRFYALLRDVLEDVQSRHGHFVVLDIHAYNHRRGGPQGPAADPRTHPEINVGTGTMNPRLWAPLVDRFIAELRAFDFQGRSLDVRENVNFRGGHVPKWIHGRFPLYGCAIAIEIKKFFMDEWSGAVDDVAVATIRALLQSTLSGLREELKILDTVSPCVIGMR
jgi:N-formylglutamate amidohydrolase